MGSGYTCVFGRWLPKRDRLAAGVVVKSIDPKSGQIRV